MFKDIMLFVHLIGFAFGFGAAIGIQSFTFEAARKAPTTIKAVARFLHIGAACSLISGLALLMPYMSSLKSMHWFHLKLPLTLAVFALMGISAKKIRVSLEGEGDAATYSKAMRMNRITTILILIIVVSAVATFH